ncbi:MAG: 2OG-Fe(II) oxygenase [Hyphomonadaceae bacterium]|nr:2OG-Fe(II) oxygenase [Hyphomonadaceae bacterium]
MFALALERGSGRAAARLAMLAAIGVAREPDWREALDQLERACELGDAAAQRQVLILADLDAARGRAWRSIREGIDIPALLAAPAVDWLSDRPRIGMVRGLASEAMAEWLIERGAPFLAPGEVNDASTGQIRRHEMRTALSAGLTVLRRDMVCAVMQARVAALTGMPVHYHEPPNLISYEPGQQFEEHFDFVDPRAPRFQDELAILGQRVATCVTYLNADFDGGETHFPQAKLKLRGGPGDCVLFVNVFADGQPDPLTVHAGLPPSRGRKWVLSQWLRSKPQPLL